MLDVTYTLECLEETDPFVGNAMASGDDSVDREAEAWIRSELNRGNGWAWFCARVTASVEIDGETFSAFDTLGRCSYKSERDFRADQYFADMKSEAFSALCDVLRHEIKRGTIAAKAIAGLA